MNNNIKLETLKAFLIRQKEATAEELKNITVENSYNENYNTFEIIGNEYKVLTDDEANREARKNILNDLWAFNADFIVTHTEFWNTCTDREAGEVIKALQEMQSQICESANSIVKALITDIDDFVSDAIDVDGRGRFISSYDGVEHWNSKNDLYIYQTN